MLNKKMVALVAAGALAACLALAGCAGQAASSSAAASTAASSTAATSASAATTTSTSAAASSAATPASSAAAASTSAATPSASAASSASYIGDQKAIEIALGDAGFAQGDVTELKCELDLDDAVVHYDVDFKQGGKEYDYDINATSGAIIQAKSEVDD